MKPNITWSGWPKQRRCLDLNVKFLFGFGFRRAEGCERRGPLFYWRYFYPRVQLIRMTYSIIFQTINISLVWGKLPLMAEHFVVIAMYFMGLIKCITVFVYQDTIHEMTTTLERMFSLRMTPNKELRINMAKADRFVHNMTKYSLIAIGSVIILLSTGVLVIGIITHTIPFRRWFPYDAYSSPAFEMTLIFTFISVPIDFTLVFVCDTLFIGLNVHIVEQFQVLSHKLRHARAIVEASRKNRERVALLTECLGETLGLPVLLCEAPVTLDSQRSGDVRPNVRERREQCSFTYDHRETIESVDMKEKGTEREDKTPLKRERRKEEVKTISEEATKNTEIEINSDMERYFKECVKHHQDLIRLCSQLNTAFKPMLDLQVICNICCGLIPLYTTTLARSVDLKVIAFLISAFVCYLQYFMFCWYGNRITEESVNVRDAVYDCDWFGASESFKRSMRIVILRTNKPIIIRAGGLPLSMRTFKKIYKASYYLNMILSKLFHGEKMIS